MNIVLFGMPGSGKGTQANFIKIKYNLTHISTGDVFRENMKNNTELGKLAKSYILKDVMGSDHAPVAIEIND